MLCLIWLHSLIELSSQFYEVDAIIIITIIIPIF